MGIWCLRMQRILGRCIPLPPSCSTTAVCGACWASPHARPQPLSLQRRGSHHCTSHGWCGQHGSGAAWWQPRQAASRSDAPLRQLPWAAQLQRAMQAAGVQLNPAACAPLQPEAVQRAAMQHYLQRVAEAAQRPGASRLWHYLGCVRPGCLSVDGYSMAAHLSEVRERWQPPTVQQQASRAGWRTRGTSCTSASCTHTCASATRT